MPRSFLVKKKTKCKDERTPSCDADDQEVTSEDVVVEDTSSNNSMTPSTAGTTSVAVRQSNDENIAESGQMCPTSVTVAGDQQRELQMPPTVHLFPLTGQYTACIN